MNTALSSDPDDHITCDPASCHVAAKARSLDGRHPMATAGIIRYFEYFEYEHLPPHLQRVSKLCHDVAIEVLAVAPDGPELTAGLRKLLEAKDCFVRAALPPL